MASVTPSSWSLRAKPRGRSKLRVGVFADAAAQPRWVMDALARIGGSDFAEIAVVAAARKGQPAFSIWKAYGRVDRWIFGAACDPLEAVPVDALVPAACRLPYAPGDRQWRTRIAHLRLDVAVALGDVDDASLEGLARHGVWRHYFGQGKDADASLAALPEILQEKDVVAAGIRIRAGGANVRLACQSWSRTVPFSLARSHDRLFGKAADFLPRSLRQLHEHGEGWLEAHGIPAQLRREEPAPDLSTPLLGITTLGARVAKRTLEHCFTVGQWSLAFRFAPHEPWDGALEGFHRLVPPPDRFWADPFPVSVGGRHYIFFEELPFDTGKGHICVVEVKRDGAASQPLRVLERDYHMSYPLLVEHDGCLYMLPETAHNNTVELYRCEEFPHRWKRERVLIDGAFLVDATVHRAGDRWWMFANSGTSEAGADDELHLFSAPQLLGDWKPHRRNPVKSDVRGSRPAGHLFQQGASLYRPSQICAPIYGSGIALHRVTRLDDEAFVEEEDRRIVPCARRAGGDAPVLGMHTLNRAGELSVTDAFVRRRRF